MITEASAQRFSARGEVRRADCSGRLLLMVQVYRAAQQGHSADAPQRRAADVQRRWAVTVPSMAYWIIGAVVVGILVVAASCRKQTPTPAAPAGAGSVFVFVRVPESLQPLDRASKYEDPLQLALDKANLGEVTGGGSQMTAPKADGSRDIEWVGIDVELTSLERGLGFLKQELIRLGVPKGTVLEYERAGKQVEDPVH